MGEHGAGGRGGGGGGGGGGGWGGGGEGEQGSRGDSEGVAPIFAPLPPASQLTIICHALIIHAW